VLAAEVGGGASPVWREQCGADGSASLAVATTPEALEGVKTPIRPSGLDYPVTGGRLA
jgi:hypothetical protein